MTEIWVIIRRLTPVLALSFVCQVLAMLPPVPDSMRPYVQFVADRATRVQVQRELLMKPRDRTVVYDMLRRAGLAGKDDLLLLDAYCRM